jgi:hypothetical protein
MRKDYNGLRDILFHAPLWSSGHACVGKQSEHRAKGLCRGLGLPKLAASGSGLPKRNREAACLTKSFFHLGKV